MKDPKSILLRKAQYEDLEAIYGLVYELAVYEKEPEALVASLEDYQENFTQGVFETIVAEENGRIVGMALYYMTYSTWKGRMLYLEDFIVTESHRRRGIGQLLFDAFIQEARHQKARLTKWQVLDWNQAAINFYEKNKASIEKGWWNVKIFLD
ncbi:MAG: GNAT family N-acetyltransferase [Bacteroidota bacterium]